MTVGSDVKTCFASIKSIEATLTGLAVQTTENETRKLFESVNQIIKEIKVDLDKQVIMLSNEEPQYKQ
ncbi:MULTISPECIES: DUF1657 domain-containing protein [unclassified Virgibacillus]|uniref:DUF1657 domain-containing protein n=1 Tax=unclassified Virgibacillus TaxID=2620237 RepID=UPI0024DDF9E2|nr:DUF1657 domain-containing protein [Virgibacillus sp. LDC-1]